MKKYAPEALKGSQMLKLENIGTEKQREESRGVFRQADKQNKEERGEESLFGRLTFREKTQTQKEGKFNKWSMQKKVATMVYKTLFQVLKTPPLTILGSQNMRF